MDHARVRELLNAEDQGAASLQLTVRSMMASMFILWQPIEPVALADKVLEALLPEHIRQAATGPSTSSSSSSRGDEQLLADLVQMELRKCVLILEQVLQGRLATAGTNADVQLQPWDAADVEQLQAGSLLQIGVTVAPGLRKAVGMEDGGVGDD